MNDVDFDFEKTGEPFKTASDQVDDKLRGALSKLSKWRSVLVLGVMMITVLVLPLVSTGLVNPFSAEFWFNAVYSLALATLSYYIFSPFGSRSERLESQTYSSEVSKWVALSNKVRENGLIESFYRFCTIRRDEEREENRALFVAAAGLPISIYEEKYSRLTKVQLKELETSGELTKKQVKYLSAANGSIKVLPINPSLILSGLRVKNINDVGRENTKKWFNILKPTTLVITMLIRGAIQISGNDNVDFLDYIAQTTMDMFVIMTWAFAGFRYGISLVREEEKLVRGRSEFLSMFLERANRKEPLQKNIEETQEKEELPT